MQFFTPLARPKGGLGTTGNQCPWEKMGQTTQMLDLSIAVRCETRPFLLCATFLNLPVHKRQLPSVFQKFLLMDTTG